MSLDSLLDSLLAVPPVPQSNTTREPLKGNGYKASSPGSPSSPGISSVLDNAIITAIGSLSITVDEIRASLDKDDVEGWINSKTSTNALVSKAIIKLARHEINQGNIPVYFNKKAVCALCGPVWLWSEANVSGCPWCSNRAENLPIPRPVTVTCGACRHFQRIDHPHLGHCVKGEPEAISGLWDTDRRNCDRWREAPERGYGNWMRKRSLINQPQQRNNVMIDYDDNEVK